MRAVLPNRRDARGAAALTATLLLLFVMTLGAAFVQRNLVFEQRAAANQYAAAQAFEAAEAGLQWVEAQLNANRRLGADCLPTGDASADSFRERYLQLSASTGRFATRGPLALGAATDRRPGCVSAAAGFACRCPSNGPASLAHPAGDGPFPAFRIELAAGDRPGVVRVASTGCNSALPPCTDAGAGRADATARVEVALGLLGALRVAPSALLTAGGHVDASAAVFPAGLPSVRAGGAGVAARTPGAAAAAGADPALAALDADRFFAASFGFGKSPWKALPAVTRVACSTDCAAALAEAVGDRGAGAMVWVDGDLDLAGPVVLGSTARPLVIVVEGEARLRGAVEIHGALYANAVAWNDAALGSGASLAGALLVERGYAGNAAVSFQADPAVLTTLTRYAGSFARVSGSWRDF